MVKKYSWEITQKKDFNLIVYICVIVYRACDDNLPDNSWEN